MEKNKSIDGLVVRHSKNSTKAKKSAVANSKTVSKKSTPKKSTAKTIRVKKTTKINVTSDNIPTEKQGTIQPNTESINTTKITNPTEDFLQPVQTFNFDEINGELQATKNDPTKTSKKIKPQKPKKVKTPMSKKKKITLSIIVIILLLILGAGIAFILWGNDIIAKITGGQGNVFDLIFQDETYVDLKTDENGRTNILAFGTSGYNMEGEEGNGVHDGAQLTDSIMVISLDQKTGDVAMVSLPRDLKASPTCTATGKINEVYWCNNMEGDNEKAGAEALMAKVGEILGIDFQYYAHLNWGSLIQIVDALDGIKVTLDEDIPDYYNTGYSYEAGVEYNIDGQQAMILSRARYGTSGGDFSRSASQQKILIGIKERVVEKNLSITDIISFASTLGDNLRTNFSIDEMKSLAHLLSVFDFNNMRQISLIEPTQYLTTGTINGISYVIPVGGAGYYTRVQEYIEKMLSSDPRTYEEPSILVLNGTETQNLASEEKTKLEEANYVDVTIDNAPEGEYTGITIYSTSDKPGTQKLLEDFYNTKSSPIEDLPTGIPTDYDFIIIIGA